MFVVAVQASMSALMGVYVRNKDGSVWFDPGDGVLRLHTPSPNESSQSDESMSTKKGTKPKAAKKPKATTPKKDKPVGVAQKATKRVAKPWSKSRIDEIAGLRKRHRKALQKLDALTQERKEVREQAKALEAQLLEEIDDNTQAQSKFEF